MRHPPKSPLFPTPPLSRPPARPVVVAAERPTTSKTRVTARGQQLVRIDEEVEDPIPPRAENQLLGQLDAAMADADAVLLEDYNKGTLTPAVIERAKIGRASCRERV